MRVRHYWRKHLAPQVAARLATVVCDAPTTIALLSPAPQPALSLLDRLVAFLTTPFKRLGIQGWKETGCTGEGRAGPVRDAQHSTDGFWTIDVILEAFSIGSIPARHDPPRYLRLEIEPGTAAHAICTSTPIRAGITIAFGGAIVIDTDANFLEIHPDADFRPVG